MRESVLATDDENWDAANDAFRVLIKTEDYWEGPKAFVEKRAPKWTGKMKAKL